METAIDSGRTLTGQFANGNPGGPGRPRRTTERDYLMALQASCALSDWMAIIRKAVEDAKSGDAAARVWLGRYLLGMPLAMPTTSLQIAVEDAADVHPVAVGAETLAAQEVRQSLIRRVTLSQSQR